MPTPDERMDSEYNALYQVSGEFIREWAEFEQFLMWPMMALLNTDQWRARMMLASHRSFRGKSDLLLQLSATFASDHVHERMTRMLKTARAVADKRNIVAHQHGGVDERVNRVIFMSDRADASRGTDFAADVTFDIANFRQWIDTIEELKAECMIMFKSCCSIVFEDAKMHRKDRGNLGKE